MKLPRRDFLHLAAGAAALPALPRIARAQAYPSRPVRWIIPFPPGGGADIVSRIMGSWLSDRLGQSIIIESKPGGGTNIGTQTVVNSPPDGYRLLLYGSSAAINATFYATLPFNLQRDIAPVAGVVDLRLALVAHPSVPVQTVVELIAYAKAHPGKINIRFVRHRHAVTCGGRVVQDDDRRQSGSRALSRLGAAGHRFAQWTGASRFRRVDPTSFPHIRSGALRALAMAGKTRFDQLPDVPTIGDTVPGYEASVWVGVGAPRGTPPEITRWRWCRATATTPVAGPWGRPESSICALMSARPNEYTSASTKAGGLFLLVSASFYKPYRPATSFNASVVPPLADSLRTAM
jgi:tripartite-type tricarboxylate transporter receptor subunit TctC